MIISSVVPPIDSTLAFMADRYFHTEAMFVGPRTDPRFDHPLRQPQ
jgi:pantothenate kinase type III